MKLIDVALDQIVASDEMCRSGRTKQFEDRLRSSIEEIGLAEPIKVAHTPSGKYLVVDGTMRLRAITAIREKDEAAFATVPAYLTDYERRYEIRYQTDIYQDLLPSQLATLVEYLHKAERVKKVDIARYLGVSPATLRNYTGLSRLIKRGGLFEKVVELMDVGVFPASNPFAWLRLTPDGLRQVLETAFARGDETAEAWIERMQIAIRQGHHIHHMAVEIELITGGLADLFYREDSETRIVKKNLGTRRAQGLDIAKKRSAGAAALNLNRVVHETTNPVLKSAAESLKAFLQ